MSVPYFKNGKQKILALKHTSRKTQLLHLPKANKPITIYTQKVQQRASYTAYKNLQTKNPNSTDFHKTDKQFYQYLRLQECQYFAFKRIFKEIIAKLNQQAKTKPQFSLQVQ